MREWWKLVWSENLDKCFWLAILTTKPTTCSHPPVVAILLQIVTVVLPAIAIASVSETITTTALLQWYHNNNGDSDSSDNDGDESEMKIARKRLRVVGG